MTSLRQAVQSKLSQNIFDGDSRYRDRLVELITDFDGGFAEKRLRLALTFLAPEWEARDQKFLRRLSRWAKETNVPSVDDLLSLTKFGSSIGYISVQIIQNNLKISYGDAFFRVLSLAALGLVEREQKQGEFYLRMKTRSQILFTLSVLNLNKFSEEETQNLADFFAPEIDGNHGEIAVRCVKEAIEAGFRLEARFPGRELDKKINDVVSRAKEAAGVGLHVNDLADEIQLQPEMVIYILLVLVATGNKVHRSPNRVHFYAGLKESNLVVWLESRMAPVKQEIIEIGSLPTDEAKRLLTAAANDYEDELDEEDEGVDLFDYEGGEGEITPETLMDILQELEDRLHAAQELEERVSMLENEVVALRQTHEGAVRVNLSRAPELLYENEEDEEELYEQIREMLIENAPDVMPKKRNNQELRLEAAKEIADMVIYELKNRYNPLS